MAIRNAAKALIVDDDGKILLIKYKNSIGEIYYGLPNGAIYYDLPGGGQNQYETLEEAVKRECLEETGYLVNVGRLAAVYEEISENAKYRLEWEDYTHKIYFVFICRLADTDVKKSAEKDFDMLEAEWVKIEDVANILLYPNIIKLKLDLILKSESTLYLGWGKV